MSGIETLLAEDRHFPPQASGVLTPDQREALREAWRADPQAYWADLARQHVVWRRPFTQVLDDSQAPVYRWFHDGTLNAAENCLDRHLPERANDTAIAWEAEDGAQVEWTYGELHDKVCRFAGTLQGLDVAPGDRVIVYMPLVPEAVVAMLACARIGAVHSVVFGGFSAKALADRIQDTGAKVVLTADGGFRGGKVVPLKQHADEALASCDVDHVVVLRRTGQDVPMQADRDVEWSYGEPLLEAPAFEAEHPLFILYTSGSTGKPKGILHSTGGYLAWAHASTRWVFDLRAGDTYWCTADIGWITGHTYVVYGPLMAGAKLVLYEGAPTYPEADRFWDIVERHQVEVLYTAPTAIRALMILGDEWPSKHDLSSLRLLGTVGEPINPEAWIWYHDRIGGGKIPIVDTWWQTETGGIMMSPLPACDTQRPGSCSGPLPGIEALIVDEQGQPAEGGGQLALRAPWPSMLRGVWGDPKRFQETYWTGPPGIYMAGDTAHVDDEGDYWILGRSDDVLNVSGHRIGTMEVESALVSHDAVGEAAVVGVPDEITGEALHAFVVLRGDADADALRAHVAKEIGKTARPKHITIVRGLPKTRSGKIMRRILRAIARGEEIRQDVSTLEDAATVEAIAAAVRAG